MTHYSEISVRRPLGAFRNGLEARSSGSRALGLCTVLLVAGWMLSAPGAVAQEGGLSFLRVGVNAEAAGMGDAQVAFSKDAFSTYWNPAGLAAASRNSAAVSYYRWILDTSTYSAAARLRAGEHGAIGLFATAMGSGDLEARQTPGDPDGTFGVQFVSTGLSYGRQIGPLRAGATAKYLTERIYSRSSTGYAIDLGVQADLFSGGIHVGAAMQNFGQMDDLFQEATEMPRTVRAGVGFYPFDILLSDDDFPLLRTLLTGQVSHFLDSERTQLHIGASVEVLEAIEMRAGYISNDALRSFSFGTGFDYEGFLFDYAFMPFEGGFGGPGHLLTFGYAW